MSETPAIRTEGLSKRYKLSLTKKSIDAVVDLNLTVNQGEVFAFIGLNGAGKTTTIKLLLDHAKPSRGKAFLFGVDAGRSEARRRIGYLPDMPYFHSFLTGFELLDYVGKIFNMPRAVRREQIDRLLKLVGLEGRGNERLKGYSRGMLQRLGLAQALINDPALVILDEPLGGLDPVGRIELRDIISGLRREGRTVFFSSHILDDAQRIADRVGIIHHGRLLACGRLDELLTQRTGWEVELMAGADFDLVGLCENHGWQYESKDGSFLITIPEEGGIRELYSLAAAGRLQLLSLGQRRLNLEEAFLKELDRWRH